ncbi:DUF4387 domain-containing protein [Amycolatopsis sp. H20-H5]|uniref:DUF4387 domain-containing protein n=1 Tax=Amycolatopsis sp. H20-H5 TaxID=3046309 RepID=UPI002DBA1308|nr:DUF4387 domain-containing protein [Amycolatopsis sp. H20-H5]MEC3974492.1 DUF4387 domain-containing protein [Amycolatopsis sp. H20-H5]
MGTIALGELADVVRSKNAGPYEITFDVLFNDYRTYAHVRDHGDLTEQVMASLFRIPLGDIVYCSFFEPAQSFKLTVLRRNSGQGGVGERDTFGCQQHAPLLGLPIPALSTGPDLATGG